MKCFIIMPYGNGLEDPTSRAELDALHNHIRDAVQDVRIEGHPDLRIECIRGDQEARPGEIIRGVVRDLVESEFAIAVLTSHNPNVFYELGVRHAIRNNTLLLAENEKDVPFDLRPQRLIIYSTCGLAAARALTQNIQEGIRGMLPAVPREFNPHYAVDPDNPVLRYLKERWSSSPVPKESDLAKELRTVRKLLEDLIGDRPQAVVDSFDEHRMAGEDGFHSGKMAERISKSSSIVQSVSDGGWGDFVGDWFRDHPAGERSHFYVRLVGGIPIVLYSFMGNEAPTGIYFKLFKSEGRIYGRFRWLEVEDISGFAVIKVESQDRISGGWWFDDRVPPEVRIGVQTVSPDHPGMNPMVWLRSIKKPIPDWVDTWFASANEDPKGHGIS
jgi:hypothetical protein